MKRRFPKWPAKRWWLIGSSVVTAAILLGAVITCSMIQTQPPQRIPSIAVRVDSDTTVEVVIDAPYEVTNAAGKVLARGKRLRPGVMRIRKNSIQLNGLSFPGDSIRLRPHPTGTFALGEINYPGELEVRKSGDKLEVINHVDIETYLAGVLFAEMPSFFPEEALRAQVVAARSYARWKLLRSDGALAATDADQVYQGLGPLPERARQIVQSTHGEVLEYRGNPFCAYYNSTCGGSTASAEDVFNINASPALTTQQTGFCRDSPYYEWKRSVTRTELTRRLQWPPGPPIDSIDWRRDENGRALEFLVKGGGHERTFTGLRFRALWNSGTDSSQRLPSVLIRSMDWVGPNLSVSGSGFGHGVGLCQYGCVGLAEAGLSYEEILERFYPGSEIIQRW